MRTPRRHQAFAAAAALATLTLMAGCSGGSGPLDSRPTTSASADASLVFPPDADIPELSSVVAPSSADATGGIQVSDEGVGVAGEGDVVVDVYFDFMCPYCGTLDQVNAADLEALVAEGGVTVVYHPVSILDRFSEGAAYSTRAVNATAVVADQAPELVPAFITALLADGTQPAENTTGLSDSQIAQVAQEVGVSRTVTDAFTETSDFEGTELRTFVPWTVAVTTMLPVNEDTGSTGTPSVLIDGQWFGGTADQDWRQPGVLKAAVEAAKG